MRFCCAHYLTCVAVLVGVLAGCDSKVHEEGLLLKAYRRIDMDAPHARRAEQIDALEELAIRGEALADTRDVCVEGQRALLGAEQKQRRAQAALRRAESQKDQPSKQSLRQVREALEASNAALETAQPLTLECEAKVSEIANRLANAR